MSLGCDEFRSRRSFGLLAFLARTGLAGFAGPAAAPAPAALAATLRILAGLAAIGLAGRDFVGQSLGLFGFDLGFEFDVERLLVVIGLFGQRRGRGRGLRDQQRLGCLQRVDLLAAVDDERLRAGHGRIGNHRQRDLEAAFQIAQMTALVIEHVERDVGAGPGHEIMGRALHHRFLETAQQLQRDRGHRAHMAGAAALRAGLGRTLQHAGADTLARHFQEAEMRDASDLDARTVLPQAVAELALHRAIVALLVHVDEIDDDQAREIAQAQLASDFLGSFEIGLERGVFDMVLARGAARIDVDRDQRLGLVDHDIAAGAQLHRGREHRVELALDTHAGEQRLAIAILPHRAHIGRHQHLHEIVRFAIAGFPGDQDFVDLLVVEIAQRSLDQRPFLIDQGGRLRLQRHVANGFPHPDQVLEVALDLGLGAGGAGGAQDDPHALGHVEILHHFLEPRAVLCAGDLATDAAATGGVGHQHRVAAGQREICRQRRALVAALFLDDLHQHHLAALDDFLDLVLTAGPEGALRHLFQCVVAADELDDVLFFLVVFVLVIGLLARCDGRGVVMRGEGVFVVMFEVRGVMVVIMVRMTIVISVPVMRQIRVFRCGGIRHPDRRFRSHLGAQSGVFLMTGVVILVVMLVVVMLIVVMVMVVVTMVLMGVAFVVMIFVTVVLVVMVPRDCGDRHANARLRRDRRDFRSAPAWTDAVQRLHGTRAIHARSRGRRPGLPRSTGRLASAPSTMSLWTRSPLTAATRTAMPRAPAAGPVLVLFFGLAMGALFRLDQGLTIRHRNLIVVGMDFAEGKEPVTVAAIFDEGGLQGGLYPRDLGKVDVTAQLLALGGLEIKLFDAVATDHDDPGLFRVGGIDQHFVWHF